MLAMVNQRERVKQNVNHTNVDIKHCSLLSRNYNTQMKNVISFATLAISMFSNLSPNEKSKGPRCQHLASCSLRKPNIESHKGW